MAALAHRTSRAALVVLGSSIAPYDPPTRVAEEFAMLDVCRGRLVAGYPVGTSMDTNYAYSRVPGTLRERYAEAHELNQRAWAAEEPFVFNGRHIQPTQVRPRLNERATRTPKKPFPKAKQVQPHSPSTRCNRRG